VLWVWVSVAYAAAVTVGVNLLLLPADPDPLLRRELAERLLAVAGTLRAPGAAAAAALARLAQKGSTSLLKLVGLAEVRDGSLKPMHAERVAKIGLVQELLASAALYADLAIEPSPAQRARLARVAEACERYAELISSGAGDLPVLPSAAAGGDEAPSALTSILAEMERIVRELPLAERPQADQPGHAKGPLAADAWTNPKYAQFALKVTAAAMFCYIAYTAVDWYGIHTCMITCTIVALGGSAGATIHKSTLRLVGCAIGGIIALASIVFLLPHMTSITQLALLVGAVAALGGWIAMGSERTNYAGLQLAFAVYLPLLEAGYVPTTDVTEMRDRFIGIVFGVIVMALVFSYVWPERAGTGMVRSLAAALRHMAAGQRAAAWQSLAEAEQLAELFAFEVEARTPAGAEQGRRIGRLIELTRRVLLAQSALDNTMDPALERAVGLALEGVATRIETGAAGELAALPRVESQSGLQEALIERVEALVRA
jgi:multidrug resistance protein MdtO